MPRGAHPGSRANLKRGQPKPIPEERQRAIVLAYDAMSLEAMRGRFHLTKERIKQVLVSRGVKLRPKGTNSI